VDPSFSSYEEAAPVSAVHPLPGASKRTGGVRASNDTGTGPAESPRVSQTLPTEIVTVVSFASELMVTDPDAFRYRWILTTAKRTTRGLWNYMPDSTLRALRVDQEWHFIYPDAASASIEVYGGTAGPVSKARVGARQAPAGRTFADDAV
jgi:hypothetical protein